MMFLRTFLFVLLPFAVSSCGRPVLTRSGLDPRRFEGRVDGKPAGLFVLENPNGMEVCLCNFGARVVSIVVPDREGRPTDVTLGFDNLDDFRFVNCNFGSTIGRYANRIAGARFRLDGQECRLTANNGPNCLHGGDAGWQMRVFDVTELSDSVVRFSYCSPDGEAGFPGTVSLCVEYTLSARNELRIAYAAVTDRPTVVNLTNHTFFNLSGDPSQSALDHVLQVAADRYTPIDSMMIPTGELAPVEATPLDFRMPRTLAEGMDTTFVQLALAGGYDHNLVLSAPGLQQPAATLYSRRSGICLELLTEEPGLQLFTSNAFSGAFRGRRGIAYCNRPAICLEPQHFPDSPNHPQWPSTTLMPGDTLRTTTLFRFSVR